MSWKCFFLGCKWVRLAGALGERCVDRLREGGGIAVGFDWESARKAAL